MIETTSMTTKQQTNKQIPKLYVLQYICQKKNVQKDTNILLKKEMPVQVLENRLYLFSRSLQNFLEKECDMRISRCVMPIG